jgi:hypothetical protein
VASNKFVLASSCAAIIVGVYFYPNAPLQARAPEAQQNTKMHAIPLRTSDLLASATPPAPVIVPGPAK